MTNTFISRNIIYSFLNNKSLSLINKYFYFRKSLQDQIKIKNYLKNKNLNNNSLSEWFADADDNLWGSVFTSGYYKNNKIRHAMPLMPDKIMQLQFTGCSNAATLRQAFAFYCVIKQKAMQYGADLSRASRILDFGCGWGRIIRFFLKDVSSSNLYGIDCDEAMIQICEKSNMNCNFQGIHPCPPTNFENNYFDIIYAYSVFSHLSEIMHKSWLIEFQRILKPNGILIVTSRRRDFILQCAILRSMRTNSAFTKAQKNMFINTNESLACYDEGGYVHCATGGGGVREKTFYGETCISQKYVETEWRKIFGRVDFINCLDNTAIDQNIITAGK